MFPFNRDFQNEIKSKQEDAIYFYMQQTGLRTIEMVGGEGGGGGGGGGEYIHYFMLESIFVSNR